MRLWNKQEADVAFLASVFIEHLEAVLINVPLTSFSPLFLFYTRWKQQKTSGVLVFSGGKKLEDRPEMGY